MLDNDTCTQFVVFKKKSNGFICCWHDLSPETFEDQVDALREKGIRAATINSSLLDTTVITYFGGLTQSLFTSLMEHLLGNNKKIVIEMDIKLIQKFNLV